MTQAESTVTQRQELPGLINAPSFPNPISWESRPTGFTVTGRVVRIGNMQARNYDTGELESWKSGDPKMIDVIILDTGSQEESWFVRGFSATKSFRQALSDAHVTGLAVGDLLSIEYVRDEPTIDPKTGKESKSLNPTKIYAVTLTLA